MANLDQVSNEGTISNDFYFKAQGKQKLGSFAVSGRRSCDFQCDCVHEKRQ